MFYSKQRHATAPHPEKGYYITDSTFQTYVFQISISHILGVKVKTEKAEKCEGLTLQISVNGIRTNVFNSGCVNSNFFIK